MLYQLLLSERQARLTAEALEFYTRFCIGQFDVPLLVQCRTPPAGAEQVPPDPATRDYHLLALRRQYFPELRGLGHSHGLGWNDKPEQQAAQIGYEVYKAILYEFNKNSSNVHSYPNCLHYSPEPVPVFTQSTVGGATARARKGGEEA